MQERNISPLLNIGSSTYEYRVVKQPFIDKEIFRPLVERGIKVIHTDIKIDRGVDLVGNILDANFRKRVQALGVKSILCSNILEHVEEIEAFWDGMLELLKDEGLLIITVPYRYPKHMDPIDTKYRPSPDEIISRCGSVTVIDKKIIRVGSPIATLMKNPIGFIFLIIRVFLPFYNHRGWITAYNKLLHLFKMRDISCVAVKIKTKN